MRFITYSVKYIALRLTSTTTTKVELLFTRKYMLSTMLQVALDESICKIT